MRTEIREVITEREVYIAEDGQEFDDADECEAHERMLVGARLGMWDYHLNKCESVGECWFVKLYTDAEIQSFIELCKYDGISHRGIAQPGLYMYTEGCYGSGSDAWTYLTRIIKMFAESEDTVSGN